MQRYPPDNSREWIRFAKDDLNVALLGSDIRREILCFHAQQAAEKALKAALVERGIDFPYTHDIGELLAILEQAGVECAVASPEANRLTRYAAITRYPGLADPVTEEEYRVAVGLAEAIVEWADGEVGGRD